MEDPKGPPTSERSTPEQILSLGLAFWGSKTLLSAVEIGLFSELAKGSLDFGTLSERLMLHPRSARDFLDALVALGMLERDGDRYSNTPETDLFLDRAKPSYVGGILEMAGARLYPFWGSLTEALRTGEIQNEAKGGGGGLLRRYLRRSGPVRGFSQSHDGHQPGCCDGYREQVSLGTLRNLRGHRDGPGRAAGTGGVHPRSSLGGWV
jgi:hypothetical protein